MLYIGSLALIHAGVIDRTNTDIDILCTQSYYDNFVEVEGSNIVMTTPNPRGYAVHKIGSKPIEFEIAKPGSTSESLYKILYENEADLIVDGVYAHPSVCLTLKLSHRYLKNSPHFIKTMRDIKLLRAKGFEVPAVLKDWLKARQKETYSYSHPVLNQSKQNFFRDDFYIYDHDTIHEAMKHQDLPAYSYIKLDQADVLCSKDKFFSQARQIQLNTVLEETYVLALERHQIPNNFEPNRRKSFLIALEKVCTSISSGWWREFAWENYDAVLDLYDDNYVAKFMQALYKGIVKPHYQKEAA